MDKKGVHSARYLWYALILFIFLLAFLYLREPALTALAVYQEVPQQKNWSFTDPSEYIFDNSLLNFSEGEVKLIPEITTSIWSTEQWGEVSLTSAILRNPGEPHDKTTEVQNQDGEIVNLNKDNSLLDLTFDTALTNGDVLSLYLREGKAMDAWLCAANTFCEAPGYGLIYFNGENGWFNLTLANLPSPQTTLALDPPPSNHLKVDQVKVYHKEIISYSSTNTTYPSSAEIETGDFQLSDWLRWGILLPEQELTGQNIEYEYSTDSGLSWVELPENRDLSSVTSSKIRLKAILTSDGQATPVLKSLSLSYVTSFCQENWTLVYDTCAANDLQRKYYLDQNQCGTIETLPSDNGTYVNCDFCTPNLTNTSWSDWLNLSCLAEDKMNQSRSKIRYDINFCGETTNQTFIEYQKTEACDFCFPVWQEINTSCWAGNTLTSWLNDINNCYAQTHLISDAPPANQTYACDYCLIHNCSASFGEFFSLENQTRVIANSSHVSLEITASGESKNLPLSIIEYAYNQKKEIPEARPLNRYLDIQSGLENISSVKIIVYYTDEEISARNLEEETLKIYYYNETAQGWEELPSILNASDNYVYALVPHLSLYGLFGQEKTITSGGSTSSGGGSGGGGGGGSRRTEELPKTTLVQERKEFGLETKEKIPKAEVSALAAEKSCDYTLEVSLPEEISFVEEQPFTGELLNKGSCAVQKINLYLSQDLVPLLELPQASLTNLEAGNKTNFIIIRKSEKKEAEEKEGLWPFLTGSAVIRLTEVQTVKGALTIEGLEEGQQVFQKEMPFDIKISVVKRAVSLGETIFLGIVASLVILVSLLVFMKRKRKRK